MPHTPDPTSTFTTRLNLEKAPRGTFDDTWADLANDNLDLIDAGIVTAGYDALIYQVAGTVYAEDRHGAILDSGADTSAVIQTALDDGGTILVREGTYTMTADQQQTDGAHVWECCLVVPYSKTTRLIGAGTGRTIFKLADNQHYADHETVMLCAIGLGGDSETYDGLEVAHLEIDGNKANQTQSAIWVDGSAGILTGGRRGTTGNARYGLHLHDLEIHHCPAAAIYMGNNTDGNESFGLLDHIYSHDNGARAIELDYTDHMTVRNILSSGNGADYASSDDIGIVAYNFADTLGSRTGEDRLVLENLVMYDRLSLINLQRPAIRGLYSDTTALTCTCGVDVYRCYEAVIETDYVASDTCGIWCHSYDPDPAAPAAYIHNRGVIEAIAPIKADNDAYCHVTGGELRGIVGTTSYGFYSTEVGNHLNGVYFNIDTGYCIAGGAGCGVTVTGCRSAVAKPSSATIVNAGGNINMGLQASGSSTGTGSAQTLATVAPVAVGTTATIDGAARRPCAIVWADATNLHATVTNGIAYNWHAEV